MLKSCKATNDDLIRQLLYSPNYRFDKDGTVFTKMTRSGKVSVKDFWRIAGHKNRKKNQINISFKVGPKRTKLLVHRIIYAAFKGDLNSDLIVYHLDGNGLNNDIENLVQGTQSEANYLAFKTRRKPVVGNFKLTHLQVRSIRRLWDQNIFSLSQISKHFKISKGHASMIINREVWKGI